MELLKKLKQRLRKEKKYLISVKKYLSMLDKPKGTRIAILFDCIYCHLRFHTTAGEYFSYKLYNYKNRYRKNFMLRYYQQRHYWRVNNRKVTDSKYGFYKKMQKFFQRQMISVPDCGEAEFLDFVQKHKKVILKPDRGSLGLGIFVLCYENDQQVLQCFREIQNKMLCEEFISQHHEMAALNPYSVNTLRIITIRHDAKNIEFISAALRIGAQPDSFVDNWAHNGIFAKVDIETGIVASFGIGHNNKKYAYHPLTGKQIIGMNLPNWPEVIHLIQKAHSELDENPIIGWDIAITETGAEIVEANSAPGPDTMQLADLIPKGEKLLKIMNDKKRQKYHVH